jgi:hypothetical protein
MKLARSGSGDGSKSGVGSENPDPNPDLLVRGTDPQILVNTKMFSTTGDYKNFPKLQFISMHRVSFLINYSMRQRSSMKK